MTSMYVKFDILSMIVVEEYVPLLPDCICWWTNYVHYWFNLYCQEL